MTVLVPAFNAEAHLREALESILAQTFRDFELLVVDDGSTDGTPAIIDRFADPRIVRLRHEQNRGIVAALSTGLSVARGEFVARQDADDLSRSDRLETQVHFLEKSPKVLMVATDSLFRSGGRDTPRENETDPLRLAWILLFYCPFAHSSVMFRKAAVDAAGGYWESERHAEDFGLWSRLTRTGLVTNIGQPLLIRRRPPGSITERFAGAMAEAARRISLENLKWAGESRPTAPERELLEMLLGNRPAPTDLASRLDSQETRSLPAAVWKLFAGFCERLRVDTDVGQGLSEWVRFWTSRALLRRSQMLHAANAASRPASAAARSPARALALQALRLSPGLLADGRTGPAAVRALLGWG